MIIHQIKYSTINLQWIIEPWNDCLYAWLKAVIIGIFKFAYAETFAIIKLGMQHCPWTISFTYQQIFWFVHFLLASFFFDISQNLMKKMSTLTTLPIFDQIPQIFCLNLTLSLSEFNKLSFIEIYFPYLLLFNFTTISDKALALASYHFCQLV